MVDCRKYREMISCYADGELSGNDKNELRRHLDECASCRSLLSLYTSITGAAAESLVEPPDDFASNVINKIKILNEDEPKQIIAANKPIKSIRPIIISFVATAACLALAFVVSPQLFHLGKSTNTPSLPMASSSLNYGLASEAAAPDQDRHDNGLKTANTRDASSAEDDLAGEIPDEQMETTTATVTPQPAVGRTPDFAMRAHDDSDMLKQYYAVIEIKGQLPAILKDFSMLDKEDGTFSIEITAETADQLKKEGFTVEMGAPEAFKALVRYFP